MITFGFRLRSLLLNQLKHSKRYLPTILESRSRASLTWLDLVISPQFDSQGKEKKSSLTDTDQNKLAILVMGEIDCVRTTYIFSGTESDGFMKGTRLGRLKPASQLLCVCTRLLPLLLKRSPTVSFMFEVPLSSLGGGLGQRHRPSSNRPGIFRCRFHPIFHRL